MGGTDLRRKLISLTRDKISDEDGEKWLILEIFDWLEKIWKQKKSKEAKEDLSQDSESFKNIQMGRKFCFCNFFIDKPIFKFNFVNIPIRKPFIFVFFLRFY